jgi:hypothetical protein
MFALDDDAAMLDVGIGDHLLAGVYWSSRYIGFVHQVDQFVGGEFDGLEFEFFVDVAAIHDPPLEIEEPGVGSEVGPIQRLAHPLPMGVSGDGIRHRPPVRPSAVGNRL